ncbi:MAG TPA: cytochrome c biogenesis protein ResB [Nitrospirota bacterium]|nr:cytochrome c biogenesis protein ResB [Nitrospirota bacterium]
MSNVFLSLKTTVWTLAGLICLFLVGSYMMPMHREIFAPMNDDILLSWVTHTVPASLWYTWWFYAAAAALALLTINTIVCGVQAIKGQWNRTDFFLRISPQVIHIGFLLILTAHLLSAIWGYRLSGAIPEGAYAPLPEDKALRLEHIYVQTDAQGVMHDWTVQVFLYENNKVVKSGTLGPNTPLFYQGVGVYLKSLNFDGGPAAILLIVRDHGAMWALIGCILFLLGSLTLLVLKWRKV